MKIMQNESDKMQKEIINVKRENKANEEQGGCAWHGKGFVIGGRSRLIEAAKGTNGNGRRKEGRAGRGGRRNGGEDGREGSVTIDGTRW